MTYYLFIRTLLLLPGRSSADTLAFYTQVNKLLSDTQWKHAVRCSK